MEHEKTPILKGALATLFLFAAHHAYGAIHYRTHWRMHGALIAIVLALLLAATERVSDRRWGTPAGKAANVLFLGLVLVPVLLFVGLYEGAYNHVLKNVLFFIGTPPGLFRTLFPPPWYEVPNDLWFELSGVLQVLPAAWTARAVAHLARPVSTEVHP